MSQKYSSDSLGNRMKEYENIPRNHLIRKMPVVMRLDGKAFHTFTRGLEKPYSYTLHAMMSETAEHLVRNIQGAVLAYTQSDEISILLRDWDKHTTDAWFDNNIQKMTSVAASMATAYFNRYFEHPSRSDFAMFDCRVWNLPNHEVANYFIWRQQDATRNSIQMLAQHHFSHKQLQNKNCSQLQDMLMTELETPVNWNDCLTWMKRGTCITTRYGRKPDGKEVRGVQWDQEIPIFTADREYVEKFLSREATTYDMRPQNTDG